RADLVPDLIAALVAHGARIQEVTEERDPLERAWVQLLEQARAEGLIARSEAA
ncbi:MAG: hypothetical protein JST92_12040, partial [Deltaproteobacteria bacterium]|nr:hypothetical protein [Deltaproteobacteria bacterium]